MTSREPPAEDEWEELEQRGGVREDSRRKRVLLRLSVEGIGREERGNFEKRVDGLKKGDGWRTWTWKRAIAAAVGMRGKSRLVYLRRVCYTAMGLTSVFSTIPSQRQG